VAGLIAHATQPMPEQILQSVSGVVVNVSEYLSAPPWPSVLPDNEAVGSLAARYFMELGLRSFAFAGVASLGFSAMRQRGFERTLAGAGFPCVRFEGEQMFGAALVRRLEEISKPVAVFACTALHSCIRRAHIELAQKLLLETDTPIASVAARSGFNDMQHFGRVFKDLTQMTPSQCRQTAQKQTSHGYA